MDTLKHRFKDKIKGIIEGFDRIVMKGMLRPLSYAAGMQMFIMNNGVLNKDYKSWVLQKSAAIVEDAEAYVLREIGEPIKYIASCNIRKETLAHDIFTMTMWIMGL